jgi:hypothetical protein
MRLLTVIYSAVFQAGGLVVVVVEIFRRNFLAAMVPVIVNAILNEHQLVIDIVAFVIKGDFHRSRLGEKQRGKILAGWVTRKMRTIAQYSIRDPNGEDNFNQITEEPGTMHGRTSTGTFRNSMQAGSFRGSVQGGSMLGMNAQMQNLQLQTGSAQELHGQSQPNFAPYAGASELPSQSYPESIPELTSTTMSSSQTYQQRGDGGDDTPTELRKEFLPEMGGDDTHLNSYFPGEGHDSFDSKTHQYNQQYGVLGVHNADLPSILQPGVNAGDAGPPEPHYGYKPSMTDPSHDENIGHFNFNDDETTPQPGDRWTLPSQQHHSHSSYSEYESEKPSGGLRVANAHSGDEEEWAQDALMHMNFAGSGPEKLGRLD